MSSKISGLLTACALLTGCGSDDSEKWAEWCEQRIASAEKEPSGKARISGALAFELGDEPYFWPDAEHHPGCTYPASLWQIDEEKRDDLVDLWIAARDARRTDSQFRAVKLSGVGEWRHMTGHLPIIRPTFVFTSISRAEIALVSQEAITAISVSPP